MRLRAEADEAGLWGSGDPKSFVRALGFVGFRV